MGMTGPIPATVHLVWSLSLFLALVALLKWKHRRMLIDRRINRGLRVYADNGPRMDGEDSPAVCQTAGAPFATGTRG